MEYFTFLNIGLLLFFISLIWGEVEESIATLVLATLLFCGVNYFWIHYPIVQYITWFNVGMYLFVGFVYSLIKTWDLRGLLTPEQKKYIDLEEYVFRWLFYWPVSLLVWIFSDLFRLAWEFIYKHVGFLYRRILGS